MQPPFQEIDNVLNERYNVSPEEAVEVAVRSLALAAGSTNYYREVESLDKLYEIAFVKENYKVPHPNAAYGWRMHADNNNKANLSSRNDSWECGFHNVSQYMAP